MKKEIREELLNFLYTEAEVRSPLHLFHASGDTKRKPCAKITCPPGARWMLKRLVPSYVSPSGGVTLPSGMFQKMEHLAWQYDWLAWAHARMFVDDISEFKEIAEIIENFRDHLDRPTRGAYLLHAPIHQSMGFAALSYRLGLWGMALRLSAA